jgi:hypothetical protein
MALKKLKNGLSGYSEKYRRNGNSRIPVFGRQSDDPPAVRCFEPRPARDNAHELTGIQSVHINNENAVPRLLKSSGSSSGPLTTIKTEKKFGLKEDHIIICRECGNPVTSPDCVISVNSHHKHTFINPAGITYQIGCFSSAEGCVVYGEPVLEHTWFAGFAWNYCICSNCRIHLGWHFQNNGEHFFGLILDLLADASANH